MQISKVIALTWPVDIQVDGKRIGQLVCEAEWYRDPEETEIVSQFSVGVPRVYEEPVKKALNKLGITGIKPRPEEEDKICRLLFGIIRENSSDCQSTMRDISSAVGQLLTQSLAVKA